MATTINVKKSVNDKIVYSKILFRIGTEKIFASNKEFLKKVGKTREVIVPQLRVLMHKKYLSIEDAPKNEKNKQLYSVNWKQILKEFIRYLKKRQDDNNKEKEYILKNFDEKFSKKTNTALGLIYDVNVFNDEEFVNRLLNEDLYENKILINGVKKAFELVQGIADRTDCTLNDFFSILLESFSSYSFLDLREKSFENMAEEANKYSHVTKPHTNDVINKFIRGCRYCRQKFLHHWLSTHLKQKRFFN